MIVAGRIAGDVNHALKQSLADSFRINLIRKESGVATPTARTVWAATRERVSGAEGKWPGSMSSSKAPQERHENSLISILPPDERAALLANLTRTTLSMRQVVQEPDQPIEHVWFPLRGVVSMISEMADGGVVEFATIGREGFAGVSIVLGTDRMAQRVVCQIPGEADVITASALRPLLDQLPRLRQLLLRYVATLLTQMAQGSACNRLHPIEARCSRWLLMTHDRVDGDNFPLTQEFLAQMLGVARPSVSIAAGILQKAGLITYVRGMVTILDRPGLEAASCECYAVITREFRRLVEERAS